MPILYALLSFVVAKLVQNSGIYPSGVDTLGHIYKGDMLYKAVGNGDFWPLFDPLWYNGMETMRYSAPLPLYCLALCQWCGGGNPLNGYLVFVAAIYLLGAISWLYIGFKVKRPFFGSFVGALWFFMPNNLYVLFHEGNLPQSMCIAILPLLMYLVYRCLREKPWYAWCELSVCFSVFALCQPGYAGLVFLAFVVYFTLDAIVSREWLGGVRVAVSLALGYLLAGTWLAPFVVRNGVSEVSMDVLADYFQDMFLSLNPAARFQRGCVDVYFGLAVLLLAVFGGLLSKRKSLPGFWTGLVIFIGTSNGSYILLSHLPGGQVLQMLRFISIALCMVLFSFLIWDTLKKGWIIIFAALLVLDALPSLPMVVGHLAETKPQEILADYAEWTLVEQAKEITKQRLALVDESALNAMGAYLATGFGETAPISYGAMGELSATSTNFLQI
jgi:Predicted integral membrane protein